MKVCETCGKEFDETVGGCSCVEQPKEETKDALWSEIEVDDSGNLKKEPDPADTGKQTEGDKGFSEKEPDPQGLSGKTDPDKAPTADQQPANLEEEVKILRKRLSDTQSWGQNLANQVGELSRMIQGGTATKAEIDGQKKVVEEAKKGIAPEVLTRLYEEVPEARAVIEPLLATVEKLSGEVETYRQSEAAKKEQTEADKKRAIVERFEREIVPEIRKTHADYDPAKLGEAGYFEWAEKQTPALRFAALNSDDPKDIAWAYGEFRKACASPEAKNLKDQQEQTKQERIRNAMTLRGGGSGVHAEAKPDPNDREAAWNDPEFDAKLKRDGLL